MNNRHSPSIGNYVDYLFTLQDTRLIQLERISTSKTAHFAQAHLGVKYIIIKLLLSAYYFNGIGCLK